MVAVGGTPWRACTGRRMQSLPAAVFPPPVPPPTMREGPHHHPLVVCECGVLAARCVLHLPDIGGAGWLGCLALVACAPCQSAAPPQFVCVHTSRTRTSPPHRWPMKYRSGTALKTHRVVWHMLLPAHVFVYSLPGRFVGMFLCLVHGACGSPG